MSIIKVKCTDQVLTFENTPVIASGGLEEDFLQVDFCSRWDGFARTAVFWRTEAEAYHAVLDEENTCPVPPEVTADEGLLYFGVFGVNEAGAQRTSEVLTYRIVKGAITTGTKPSDPTPDIYTQLLQQYAEAAATVPTKADKVTGAVAGNLAALDAEGNLVDSGKNVDNLITPEEREAWNAKEEGGAAAEALSAAKQYTNEQIAAIPSADVSGLIAAHNADTGAHEDIREAVSSAASAAAAAQTTAEGKVDNNDNLLQYVSGVMSTLGGSIVDLGGAKIVTGTYVGTGTYGTDNPNSLTFDFAPQMLIMVGYVNTAGSRFPLLGLYNRGTSSRYNCIMSVNFYTEEFAEYGMCAGASTTNSNTSKGRITNEGKTFEWYATDSAFSQCNGDGATYYYMAIG